MRRGSDGDACRLCHMAGWAVVRVVVEVLATKAQVDDAEIPREPFLRCQLGGIQSRRLETHLEGQLVRKKASN